MALAYCLDQCAIMMMLMNLTSLCAKRLIPGSRTKKKKKMVIF